jgi:hypothetical protein
MKFIESYVNELLTTALTMMIGFYLGMGWWVVLLGLIGGTIITLQYLKEKRLDALYRREKRRGYGWHEHRELDKLSS